jgi:hypothetical protein
VRDRRKDVARLKKKRMKKHCCSWTDTMIKKK